ncbi:MAG: DUF4293 domain-containing protein [Flavobacteriaceae bacterium]
MIQRVQSLYLLGALLANFAYYFMGQTNGASGQNQWSLDSVEATLEMVLMVLIVWSIFKFKQRLHQFVLNRLSIILNFVLVGVFAYQSLSLPGEASASQKGIGVVLPIISIVFLVLANKAIKRDEDLVKSVDRLR